MARGVGGDGEGLEGGQVDGVLPISVQQLRRGVAEAEALLDDALGDAEAGGDVGNGGAGEGKRAEGLDLVCGVHCDVEHVLGERDLGVAHAVLDDTAGHGEVGSDGALAGELVERGEAPGACDDGEALAAVLGGTDGAGHEVLDQAVGGDGCLELGEGGLAGLGPADVGGRALQPVEGDGSDDGVVHETVSGNAWMGRGPDSLREHRPSPEITHPARPLGGARRVRGVAGDQSVQWQSKEPDSALSPEDAAASSNRSRWASAAALSSV